MATAVSVDECDGTDPQWITECLQTDQRRGQFIRPLVPANHSPSRAPGRLYEALTTRMVRTRKSSNLTVRRTTTTSSYHRGDGYCSSVYSDDPPPSLIETESHCWAGSSSGSNGSTQWGSTPSLVTPTHSQCILPSINPSSSDIGSINQSRLDNTSTSKISLSPPQIPPRTRTPTSTTTKLNKSIQSIFRSLKSPKLYPTNNTTLSDQPPSPRPKPSLDILTNNPSRNFGEPGKTALAFIGAINRSTTPTVPSTNGFDRNLDYGHPEEKKFGSSSPNKNVFHSFKRKEEDSWRSDGGLGQTLLAPYPFTLISSHNSRPSSISNGTTFKSQPESLEVPTYSCTVPETRSTIISETLQTSSLPPPPPQFSSVTKEPKNSMEDLCTPKQRLDSSTKQNLIISGSMIFSKNTLTHHVHSKRVVPNVGRQAIEPPISKFTEEDAEFEETMSKLRKIGPVGQAISCDDGLIAGGQRRRLETPQEEEEEDEEGSCSSDLTVGGGDEEVGQSFALPTWPRLACTTRSPFLPERLGVRTFRPTECSISAVTPRVIP